MLSESLTKNGCACIRKYVRIIEKIKQYVTESIWVGPMNYIKAKGLTKEGKKYYDNIRKLVETENLIELKEKLDAFEQVRLKDAFLNRIN